MFFAYTIRFDSPAEQCHLGDSGNTGECFATTAIARSLSMSAKVLILDEPTTFLDPPAESHLFELLRALPQAKILITHDTAFAKTPSASSQRRCCPSTMLCTRSQTARARL